ncbi:helix-turn-helix transcriptional regulator [Serratia marcescens]|uniref:helix-turn-helix transcriptional regulator n=1 Tax=Serratia marcescens TaxID=615 RepID=UPI0013DBCCDA|nr:LuxR C-terminal-related transcriptional regulator [Serratia marcescens]
MHTERQEQTRVNAAAAAVTTPRSLSIISSCALTQVGLTELLTPHVENFSAYASPAAFIRGQSLKGHSGLLLFHVCPRNVSYLRNIVQLYRRLPYHPNWRSALLMDSASTNGRYLTKNLGSPIVFHLHLPIDILLRNFLTWMYGEEKQIARHGVRPESLSDKERQVILATLQGIPISSLARERGVTAKTVYTQRRTALDRLGIKNTRELLCLNILGLL